MEKQKKSKSEWFFVPHFVNKLPHKEERSKESDFYLFFFIYLWSFNTLMEKVCFSDKFTDIPIVKQS